MGRTAVQAKAEVAVTLPAVYHPAAMTYEQLTEEWQEWLDLAPLERFRRSEEFFAQYLAMGGSLDPDPDPTSPFDFPEEWRPGAAHGRAGLHLLRRGAG
jgi:hypothetical protein